MNEAAEMNFLAVLFIMSIGIVSNNAFLGKVIKFANSFLQGSLLSVLDNNAKL